MLSHHSYLYSQPTWNTIEEFGRKGDAATRMLAWACVGIHQWEQEKSARCNNHPAPFSLALSLRSTLTLTGTVNSEWPACACHSSKAVTVGHISLWPGMDVTNSNIPVTYYHAHAEHRTFSAAHPTIPLRLSPPPHPHTHIQYTHQHLSRCTTRRWPLPKCGQNVPFTRAAGQSK